MTEWMEAYLALQERIEADPQFMALVKAMTGYPRMNNRRARMLSTRICERLEIDPAIFRGNVYGAAIAYQERRHIQAEVAGFVREEQRMGIELWDDVERNPDGEPDLERDFLA